MDFTVLLGLNAIALTFMFLYLKRRIDKKLQTDSLLENVRKEINGILLEINRTTERNVGLIEDLILRLKEIMESANKRILVLRRESEKHEVETQVYSQILQKRAGPQGETGEPAKKGVSAEEVLDLNRKGISAGIIANKLGSTIGEVELIISLHDTQERA